MAERPAYDFRTPLIRDLYDLSQAGKITDAEVRWVLTIIAKEYRLCISCFVGLTRCCRPKPKPWYWRPS